MWLTCLPEHIPEARPLLDRDVELPAEVADIGDPGGQRPQRPDLDRAAGREREALVGDVVAGRTGQDLPRPRPPEADRAPRGCEVDDLRAPVGRQLVGEPLQVGHAVQPSGDDAEVLVAEPHDRQIGAKAAAPVQYRRVDDPAGGDVHLTHRDRLEPGQRAGPEHVEDAECGQVEERRARAHRQMLGTDDRRPPARLPLRSALHHLVAELLEEQPVRLVPVRTLPTGGLEEERAELAFTGPERREPQAPVRLPLLATGGRSRRSC